MGRNGFTLIELVMVLVLAGIIAAVASPFLFKGSVAITVPAFAAKVLDDIRYAQNRSMMRSNLDTPEVNNPVFYYRIRFNVADANCTGTNQYTIVNDADNNGTWGENPNSAGVTESAREPSKGADYFCVQMDSGDYAGFTIAADFGGSVPSVLQFDSLGVPYDSDGARIVALKTVTVSKSGESASITITPNTGHAALQ